MSLKAAIDQFSLQQGFATIEDIFKIMSSALKGVLKSKKG